jgi:Glycosyl transferase family 90
MYTASRAKSTLHSLHRALVATPDSESLPSIEFHFSADDFVWDDLKLAGGPIWAYSKRDTADIDINDSDDSNIWLMPDFGYWAWPEVDIAPYRETRRRIAAVDSEYENFQAKKKQLLWRGSLNTASELRNGLVDATKNKYWASVRVVDWADSKSVTENVLPIEDHCRYMFLAHTEGRSFSGRGKYLLNCHSVFITHPLIWREAHHAALISSGPDANYVQVARDFSNLETKIEYLLDNPQVAERIANNSVETFRDRYLTPAAEACYWRYLVRKYAEVSDFEPKLYDDRTKKMRGQSYEQWVLSS